MIENAINSTTSLPMVCMSEMYVGKASFLDHSAALPPVKAVHASCLYHLQSYAPLKSVHLKCGKCWFVANPVIDVVAVNTE